MQVGSPVNLQLVALTLILLIIAFFFGAPLLWLIFSSLDPNASPEFKVPSKPTLSHYLGLNRPIGNATPLRWIVNSVILSAATATLTTVVAVLSAYTLTRHPLRWQKGFITLLVVFRLTPSIVLAVPVMVLLRYAGMLNSYTSLVIVMTALILPFAIMILESYFRAIPVEYEEAAVIDGLSRPEAFLRVTLPLAAPGIATVWLLAFVIMWSEFVIPIFILGDPAKYPASVGLWFFFGEHGRVDYGRLSAFSILYSIPAIIVFMLIRKHLERGLAALASR